MSFKVKKAGKYLKKAFKVARKVGCVLNDLRPFAGFLKKVK